MGRGGPGPWLDVGRTPGFQRIDPQLSEQLDPGVGGPRSPVPQSGLDASMLSPRVRRASASGPGHRCLLAGLLCGSPRQLLPPALPFPVLPGHLPLCDRRKSAPQLPGASPQTCPSPTLSHGSWAQHWPHQCGGIMTRLVGVWGAGQKARNALSRDAGSTLGLRRESPLLASQRTTQQPASVSPARPVQRPGPPAAGLTLPLRTAGRGLRPPTRRPPRTRSPGCRIVFLQGPGLCVCQFRGPRAQPTESPATAWLCWLDVRGLLSRR